MSPLDIVLIVLIAAVLALALRRVIKKKGSCSCGSSCDSCSSCSGRGSCDRAGS